VIRNQEQGGSERRLTADLVRHINRIDSVSVRGEAGEPTTASDARNLPSASDEEDAKYNPNA
jgi:hypothetical protein